MPKNKILPFFIIVYFTRHAFHSPVGRLWHSVRRQNVVHKMMGRILFHFFQNTKKKMDAALALAGCLDELLLCARHCLENAAVLCDLQGVSPMKKNTPPGRCTGTTIYI